MFLKFFVLFCSSILINGQIRETLDDRIQRVFNVGGRGTFDMIVTPEPNVSPTNSPQVLQSGSGECKCVPYYNCENPPRVDTTENRFFGEIDVRYDPQSCQDVLDVCCPTNNETPVPIAPPLNQMTPPPIVNPNVQRPAAQSQCGLRNVNGIDFTVIGNGNEAGFAEFPWMVALLVSDRECLCGGSLIHPRVVLTGAHCVFNISQHALRVRAGEWDTQTTKERLPHQERNVASIITHTEFNARTLANDIALILLDQPFNLDQHINVVCLPSQNYIAIDRNCYASGWGKDIFGKEGKYSVILKKVELPIVPFHVCQEELRKTRLGRYFNLHDSFICAGGEADKDTCQGDGGSPLVCPISQNEPSRYYQTGIVAWGIGCHTAGVPAVYTNVAGFRSWIDGQVRNLGLDTSSYSA
jgi:hypothetical protein